MAGARSDGASGCESGNLPGLVEAGTLRERECGDWPRYSREAFLLREEICVWLDWRSERELRGWLMRGRQSAGKSACATCREGFCFSGVEFLWRQVGPQAATTDSFVHGDFCRDAWLRRTRNSAESG